MSRDVPFRGLKNVTSNSYLRTLVEEYREKDMDEAAEMLEAVIHK